jgi:hypothetical protein
VSRQPDWTSSSSSFFLIIVNIILLSCRSALLLIHFFYPFWFSIQNMTCTNFYFAFVYINPTRQYIPTLSASLAYATQGGTFIQDWSSLHRTTRSKEEEGNVLLICDSHRTRLLLRPSAHPSTESHTTICLSGWEPALLTASVSANESNRIKCFNLTE